jgi:hypothetical protein
MREDNKWPGRRLGGFGSGDIDIVGVKEWCFRMNRYLQITLSDMQEI